MKRKHSQVYDEESRLSQLLFSGSKNFVEKLKPEEYNELDLDRKPVWIDEDDENFTSTNVESKVKFPEKLKQKYETLMGTPNWAKLNKKIKTEDDDDNELLRTVGHLHKKKSALLPKDYLEIKRFPIINGETRNEGRNISCVEFHPKLSVALVAGNAGVVSLFSIGGDVNDKLHSFKLNKWKVSSVQFTPSGSEAYLSTILNHSYCVYDLVKAEPKLVPLPLAVNRPKIFQLSPDGKYIATSNGFDEVYLISTASKELLRSFKHNAYVKDLTFNATSEQIYCYSTEGEVTIWDLSTFRAVKKFYDQGCVNASCITASACGKLLATGSCEGIVNLYETSKLDSLEPFPIKTISNLKTRISSLKFNATSEILAASSNVIPNAVKLLHLPSYKIYMNFPKQSDNMSKIETVNFSPNSGFMALGNDKGCASLYRLKYYKNY